MMLRQVVYTSRSTRKLETRELLSLLHEARGFNEFDEITGLLVHSDGYFMQIIEGPSENICDLLQRLERDPMHTDLQIISDQAVEKRTFPDWSMGCADFNNPGLATLPGVKTDFSDQKGVENFLSDLLNNPEAWRSILAKN